MAEFGKLIADRGGGGGQGWLELMLTMPPPHNTTSGDGGGTLYNIADKLGMTHSYLEFREERHNSLHIACSVLTGHTHTHNMVGFAYSQLIGNIIQGGREVNTMLMYWKIVTHRPPCIQWKGNTSKARCEPHPGHLLYTQLG